MCSPCGPSKYIIDQSAPCQECPKGALCPDGALFLPIANGSVWEEVASSNGGIQKRIVECPPGYSLEREEAYPNADNCLACAPTTYRLEPTFINSTKPHCIACDPKATCRGSDVVESLEGYWRFAPVLWDDTYEYLPGIECLIEGAVCLFPDQGWTLVGGWVQPTMWCSKLQGGGDDLFCARASARNRSDSSTRRKGGSSSTTSSSATSNEDAQEEGNVSEITTIQVVVLRCPVGACAPNNTCLQNRTGPVCGYCAAGFVMEADGCSAKICASEQDLAPWRNAFISLMAVFAFLLYLALSCRPVLPGALCVCVCV